MNDELTTRLTRQLHDQVDGLQGAPLTLDSVRGKARSIRRTRRAVAGGAAVAAVLAVVVPLGLSLDSRPDSGRPPVTNTPTEAVDPTPRADGTFPLTLDVAEGDVPASGYLVRDDRSFVSPDGVRQLPGRFLQLRRYPGGWIGLREEPAAGGDPQVVTMDANFQELSAVPANGGLVSNSDGSRMAWVEKIGNEGDWTVVNASLDGGGQLRTPTSPDTAAVGFLADDTVATAYTLDSGEVSFSEASTAGEFDSRVLNGSDTLSRYQAVRGTSTAAGLVAGQTEFNGDSTCSQVRDTAAEQVVFETCDYLLGEFSPDGRWLIGYASYSDYGSPLLAILDAATGLPVVEFSSDRSPDRSATVQSAVWDDDDTLVALVEESGEQAVLRAESNGALSRVSDVRQTRDLSLEFFLPGKPFGQN